MKNGVFIIVHKKEYTVFFVEDSDLGSITEPVLVSEGIYHVTYRKFETDSQLEAPRNPEVQTGSVGLSPSFLGSLLLCLVFILRQDFYI